VPASAAHWVIRQAGSQFYLEGCGVLAQATAYTDISNNLITNFSYTGTYRGEAMSND
jgi:hypothetical protein